MAPASRVIIAVIGILLDAALTAPPTLGRPLPPEVEADLHALLAAAPQPVPDGLGCPPEALLATAFTLWTQLFGLVGFETFNRLDGMIEARDAYFDHQLQVMADLAGLPGR